MKTTHVILILIIGILIGYLIRMAVHPRKGDNTPVDSMDMPIKISANDAQILINNYIGKRINGLKKDKYYFFSDVLLSQINWVRNNKNSDGTVVYLGATMPDSEECNVAIIGRLTGTTPEHEYFSVAIPKGSTGLCPYICDVPEPDGTMPVVSGNAQGSDETVAPTADGKETETK